MVYRPSAARSLPQRAASAWRLTLDFRGRATRRDALALWLSTLLLTVIGSFALFLAGVKDNAALSGLLLLLAIPLPALLVRRGNDAGLPAPATLLSFALVVVLSSWAQGEWELHDLLLSAMVGTPWVLAMLVPPEAAGQARRPDPRTA